LRQYFFLFGIPIIPALLTGLLLSRQHIIPPPQSPLIKLEQIASDNSVIWVDARPETADQRTHIPGARLLNDETWDTNFPELLKIWNPNRKLVIYCNNEYCRTLPVHPLPHQAASVLRR
jgi:hypothetical protein